MFFGHTLLTICTNDQNISIMLNNGIYTYNFIESVCEKKVFVDL